MHTISQVENPSVTPTANTSNIPPNEDSNTSGGHPDAKGKFLIIYQVWVLKVEIFSDD